MNAIAASPGWAECLMEAWGLGTFLLSAGVFATLLEAPGSPVRRLVPSPALRRALMGLAMGLTALGILLSPWGRRSGAHLNPAVTLTFWWLGRIDLPSALLYVLSQLGGGLAGVLAARAALGRSFAGPPVRCVVTVPGPRGRAAALAAELVMSFTLMAVVLALAGSSVTSLVVSALVAVFIALGAPYSGMSINPARTLASAILAREASGLWIYLTAPVAGMLAAAALFG